MTSRVTKMRGWQRLPHPKKRGIFNAPGSGGADEKPCRRAGRVPVVLLPKKRGIFISSHPIPLHNGGKENAPRATAAEQKRHERTLRRGATVHHARPVQTARPDQQVRSTRRTDGPSMDGPGSRASWLSSRRERIANPGREARARRPRLSTLNEPMPKRTLGLVRPGVALKKRIDSGTPVPRKALSTIDAGRSSDFRAGVSSLLIGRTEIRSNQQWQ